MPVAVEEPTATVVRLLSEAAEGRPLVAEPLIPPARQAGPMYVLTLEAPFFRRQRHVRVALGCLTCFHGTRSSRAC